MEEADALRFVGNRLISNQNPGDIHGQISVSGQEAGQGIREHSETEHHCLGENRILQMQKPQQTHGDKRYGSADGNSHHNLKKQHLRDSSGREAFTLHET